MPAARIKVVGAEVLIEIPAGAVPAHVALLIARELHKAALEADTVAKREGIIQSQAFALRSGFPFGFTTDPVLMDEARKEAGHNSELRKLIPITPEARPRSLGLPQVTTAKTDK